MAEQLQAIEEYIQRSRKGDREAFENLVKLHTSYVYNLAYNLTAGNRAESDDLTQQTFLRAYQAVSRFEGRSEFKTWLHRITVNLWKNMVRSQKRRKYFQHQSIDETPPGEETGRVIELRENRPGPDEQYAHDETARMVRGAISRLPADEREVMVLRDLEGYAYEEIAAMLKLPLGTVKSRLARARRLLREALDPVLRSS